MVNPAFVPQVHVGESRHPAVSSNVASVPLAVFAFVVASDMLQSLRQDDRAFRQ